mmetsp:Transcript_32772/g.101490  ORF Transcript_32772/g.101490 Transcript_32772/m.101490 type:complete len:308 (-) Transcript_32772:502-1425(-)
MRTKFSLQSAMSAKLWSTSEPAAHVREEAVLGVADVCLEAAVVRLVAALVGQPVQERREPVPVVDFDLRRCAVLVRPRPRTSATAASSRPRRRRRAPSRRSVVRQQIRAHARPIGVEVLLEARIIAADGRAGGHVPRHASLAVRRQHELPELLGRAVPDLRVQLALQPAQRVFGVLDGRAEHRVALVPAREPEDRAAAPVDEQRLPNRRAVFDAVPEFVLADERAAHAASMASKDEGYLTKGSRTRRSAPTGACRPGGSIHGLAAAAVPSICRRASFAALSSSVRGPKSSTRGSSANAPVSSLSRSR